MSSREQKTIEAGFAKLTNSQLHRFPSARGRLDAPTEPGVYVIYNPQLKVLHVGDTYRARRGLYQRLANHLHGQSSFTLYSEYLMRKGATLAERCEWLRKNCQYRCLVVTNHRRRVLLEAYAIGHLCPMHIGLHQVRETGERP